MRYFYRNALGMAIEGHCLWPLRLRPSISSLLSQIRHRCRYSPAPAEDNTPILARDNGVSELPKETVKASYTQPNRNLGQYNALNLIYFL